MTQLADSTVWITGASSGIGEALAKLASAGGARLILTARRAAELERVRSECRHPERVAVLPIDLVDFDAESAAVLAESFFGPIDILVNNAGVSQRSLLRDTEMAVYRRILELDFFAPVALTKALLPSMLKRRSGHVVVISSVAGKFGVPLRTGYCAAKHALQGFFDAARAELWREGLKFSLVCPGYIRTNVSVNAMNAVGEAHGKMDTSVSKGMPVQRCAVAIWQAVAADREEVLIGAREAALVRFRQYAPRLFSAAIKRSRLG